MKILRGDCRASMATMADASIDSIVTDPPYEIGFMGAAWDRSGIAFDVAMWREALRVLKPGGHLVAFASPRTYHRMACAIEDAGFEIRDQLMWIFGQGFPKGGVKEGVGTQLKPAHEPIVLARKPCGGPAWANIGRYGTGGLNIDACRISTAAADAKAMARCNTPGSARMAAGGGFHGSSAFSRSIGTGAMDTTVGRWPATVMLDGSDEVIAEFPITASGGGNKGSSNNEGRTVYGAFQGARSDVRDVDIGSAARFFYCAKASRADREEGCDHLPKVKGRANIHKTVKPEGVMRWLVRLATPVGGLVLDPFAGSGSTGKAALLEGRRFVGCELGDDHAAIAEARIAAAAARADRQPLAA